MATWNQRGSSLRFALSWLGVFVVTGTLVAQVPSVTNPRGIAEGPSSQVLVADRTASSIIALDSSTLDTVWSFLLPPEGKPFGLATYGRLVFVGNTETHNVEVYKLSPNKKDPLQPMMLEFQYNLGFTPPGQLGSLERPNSIAVDAKKNRVFVLDAGDRKIKVFDVRGALLDIITPTDNQGLLLNPVSIAVDSRRQEVLISDFGDPSGFFSVARPGRILIYSTDGQYLSQINGNGSTNSATRFVRPQGLAVTPSGRILVAEALGSRILVLDRKNGALLGEIGSPGSDPGQLRVPVDLFLDSRTGDVFVSNSRGARRVEVFRGAGR
jgi:DNA-binding beta-propeller fold protein YncE